MIVTAGLTRRRSLAAVGLGALLLWSFAFRIWFALPDLTGRRFWDERYGLENIESLLFEHELRPANGFHPSFSYLPEVLLLGASHALHRATGVDAFRVRREPKQTARATDNQPGSTQPNRNWVHQSYFSSTAYFLCRLLQVLFGTLSLYLTFVLGRQLFSVQAGLLGTLFLSGVFWHYRQSAIYKPDILLVLISLLVLYWSLRALEKPSRSSFLVCGCLIGLALSTKFNAGPIALPLILVTLLHRKNRRTWRWLVLAGLASVGVFLVLNPYFVLAPELFQRDFFGRTLGDYANKGARFESSHLYVLWHGFLTLLSANFHGLVQGALGLTGLLAFSFSPAVSGERRRQSSLCLCYVAGYAAIYSLSTTNPSEHNWLLVAPLVALFAGGAFWEGWKWASERLPLLRRPVAAALAAGLVTTWSLLPSTLVSYPIVVPSTHNQAATYLARRLRPVSGRVVVYESDGQWMAVRRSNDLAASFATPTLSAIGSLELDRADAEVFLQRNGTDEREGPFLRQRTEPFNERRIRHFEPRFLRVRGPALTAVVHPWNALGTGTPLDPFEATVENHQATTSLPADFAAGDTVSLELRLSPKAGIRRLSLGGETIPLTRIGTKNLFRSARFAVPEDPTRIELELDIEDPTGLEITGVAQSWRRGRGGRRKRGG